LGAQGEICTRRRQHQNTLYDTGLKVDIRVRGIIKGGGPKGGTAHRVVHRFILVRQEGPTTLTWGGGSAQKELKKEKKKWVCLGVQVEKIVKKMRFLGS